MVVEERAQDRGKADLHHHHCGHQDERWGMSAGFSPPAFAG
jgi:hypothetical protein